MTGVSAEALDIILRLQGVPTYTAGMGEASGANDKFAASSKRAAQMSNEAAAASERQRGAAALLSKAAKGIGLTLAAAGVEGVKMAIKFEKQMEMIHTQAGASQAEVGRLKKEVLALAGAVPQGPEELAKGLYHLESIGLRGANAMDALKIAAQGAAVGNTDLESTASALGAAWIVGIKGAGGFRSTMGVLNATVGAGNMRMGELVTALGSGILPVAKLTGLTIQDVGAALATLSDSGYSASSAAAQLGTSLHFLYSPTSRAKKALESIGLTSKQVFEQLQGPAGLHGALELLKSHLSGAGDHAEQMEKLGEIFPGGRGKVILTLLAELERLEMKRKQIIATGGNFGDSVKRTMEQPAVKIEKAWSKFKATLIELGLELEGPATEAMVVFASALGLGLHIVMALSDNGKLLVPIIVAMAGAWLIYKGAVMGAAIAAMDANPVGLIALAVAALVAGLVLLIMHFHQVVNFLRGPWGTILILLTGLFAPLLLIPLHFKQIINAAKGVINWIKKEWGKLGHILALPFEWMWGKVAWVLKQIKKGIGALTHLGGGHGGGGGILDTLKNLALGGIPLPIPFAAGGVMPYGGLANINEGASGETVYLPGGSVVQPSPASSLLNVRAHTPNPAPASEGAPVYIEAWLELPPGAGRSLFKLVTKEAAIKKART